MGNSCGKKNAADDTIAHKAREMVSKAGSKIESMDKSGAESLKKIEEKLEKDLSHTGDKIKSAIKGDVDENREKIDQEVKKAEDAGKSSTLEARKSWQQLVDQVNETETPSSLNQEVKVEEK